LGQTRGKPEKDLKVSIWGGLKLNSKIEDSEIITLSNLKYQLIILLTDSGFTKVRKATSDGWKITSTDMTYDLGNNLSILIKKEL